MNDVAFPAISHSLSRPLNVMFVITNMPVGGAETLLVNLVRRIDRSRFAPHLVCLKEFGVLGEVLAGEIPAWEKLIRHKYDLAVLGKLAQLMRDRRMDAVVTVGTGGDKMFWGRLAAWRAGVPVVLSALHSTGLPDRVELPNRLLAPWTDGFIAVAEPHARYLAEHEGCPQAKVFVIPNGVDVDRFRPMPRVEMLRAGLGIPQTSPVAAIVAALRPEKNHELFLAAAAQVLQKRPDARFMIIGDGPRRESLQELARSLKIAEQVLFLGTRGDIPELLSLVNVVALSSHMEANPVSILEALACGKPVVATDVGSVSQTVRHGETGYLVPPGDATQMAARLEELFANPSLAAQLGTAGRNLVVDNWSLERMVRGYEDLILTHYVAKRGPVETSRAELPVAWHNHSESASTISA